MKHPTEIFTNADAIVISSNSIVYSIVIFTISNFNIFINIVKFALSNATSNAKIYRIIPLFLL